MSVAEATVDWERTDRYAEAVRASRYAETRGEEDFKRLSADVARTLNEVSLTPDPARLAIADNARQVLAEWPLRNYGYRAQDVAQLSALLDELVSELRAAAGQSRFDLSLVASTRSPPPVPLLPAPGFRESIEQAFTVARLTPDPPSACRCFRRSSERLRAGANETWAAALRARAFAELCPRAHRGALHGV